MAALAFNPAKTVFDLQNSLSLAQASNLAYENKRTIEKKAKQKWRFTDVEYFEDKSKDAQAFLAADNDKIIVAFRGTEPSKLKDWFTDLNFWPEKGPVGRVHGGLAESFNAIWGEILEKFST